MSARSAELFVGAQPEITVQHDVVCAGAAPGTATHKAVTGQVHIGLASPQVEVLFAAPGVQPQARCGVWAPRANPSCFAPSGDVGEGAVVAIHYAGRPASRSRIWTGPLNPSMRTRAHPHGPPATPRAVSGCQESPRSRWSSSTSSAHRRSGAGHAARAILRARPIGYSRRSPVWPAADEPRRRHPRPTRRPRRTRRSAQFVGRGAQPGAACRHRGWVRRPRRGRDRQS
jgi:hypothetical protein